MKKKHLPKGNLLKGIVISEKQILVTFFLYFNLKQKPIFTNNVGHIWFPFRKSSLLTVFLSISFNELPWSALSDSSNPKKDVASLKRWMIVMGVGYLTQGSNIGDSKKFVQLCTVLMDKVEQRHGSKLKPIVSFSKYIFQAIIVWTTVLQCYS